MTESYENMEISKARATCAREFRELKGYMAIDYELNEARYGRIDESEIGVYCESCPVLRDLGECSLRTMFQNLSHDHRIKYELDRSGTRHR